MVEGSKATQPKCCHISGGAHVIHDGKAQGAEKGETKEVVVDEKGRGFAGTGVEQHILEKWFILPQCWQRYPVAMQPGHHVG